MHQKATLHVETKTSWTKWRVVLICFLAQNCAMGLVFGSFGPLLASNEIHFTISKAAAAAGMSLISLTLGLLSPVAGSLLSRFSVRKVMILATAATGLSYWGIAVLQSYKIALVLYAIIGAGVSLAAILGPLTVISRWFEKDRGKVLGFINLPIFFFLAPYLIGDLLPVYGRFWIVAGIGSIFFLLTPLLIFLVESPEQAGLLPHGYEKAGQVGISTKKQPVCQTLTKTEIFKVPSFWLLSFGIAIMAGAGTAFMVHIVSFGMDADLSFQQAVTLLTVYAGFGIFGTLLFGWLADLLGPPVALMISTFIQAAIWWGFLQVDGVTLYIFAGIFGVCIVPIITLHGAAMTFLFGAANASKAMGLSYAIKLPFLFTFAPIVGYMYDHFHGYHLAFTLLALLLVVAGLLFSSMFFLTRSGKTAQPATS